MSREADYITRQVIGVNGGLVVMTRACVVTGMAGITSLGQSWAEIEDNLRAGASGVQRMPEWERYADLLTRLGAPVADFALPPHYTRKTHAHDGPRRADGGARERGRARRRRPQGRSAFLESGRVGVAYGSSTGSTDAIRDFGNMLTSGESGNINATTYIRMMGHTAAVNIGVHFGLQGRVIPTSSACTSGSQGIGYAYEAIRFGLQDAMVAGGAEELCVSEAAVFDTLYATSTRNDAPKTTPAPFDKSRDGLVIGEGACTLVLEERERALARGARIYAEIVGFASNSDGDHVTHPNTMTMERVMRMALDDAGHRRRGGAVHQRARHRDRARRHRGIAGDLPRVRAEGAGQLAQGPLRPHARRLRRARELGDDPDDAWRLVRADAQSRRRSTSAAATSTIYRATAASSTSASR